MSYSHRSEYYLSPSWTSAIQFMWLPLDICQTNCSPCWMLPHRSSTCDACKNTWLHCFGNCTSYLYTSESSIGISLYARHSTSVSGRQPAVDISGGRLLPSTFCRLTNDASTINLSVNPRWPHISCGCNNENSLPPQSRTVSSLLTFLCENDSHLFCQSFGWQKPGIVSTDWQAV